MSPGAEARRYLRRHRSGVLSTISKKLAGYPFGSATPFVLDHAARPVILVSRLAEHTKNIEADPRASLLVANAGGDVQAGARLTLIGDAARASDDPDAPRARYLRYFPDAARLFAMGDFSFFHIEPRLLRFIGGFGDIKWIAAEAYAPPASRLAGQEEDILAHMNADHADNLRDYCRHWHGKMARGARMIGIDCDGFDVRADGEVLRFDIEHPVTDAEQAREALVMMARTARSSA